MGALNSCAFCGRTFDTYRNLNVHLVHCHPQIYEENSLQPVAAMTHCEPVTSLPESRDDMEVTADDVDITSIYESENERQGAEAKRVQMLKRLDAEAASFRVFATTRGAWPCYMSDCTYISDTFMKYNRHIIGKHWRPGKVQPFRFRCFICGKQIVNFCSTKMHMTNAHYNNHCFKEFERIQIVF